MSINFKPVIDQIKTAKTSMTQAEAVQFLETAKEKKKAQLLEMKARLKMINREARASK